MFLHCMQTQQVYAACKDYKRSESGKTQNSLELDIFYKKCSRKLEQDVYPVVMETKRSKSGADIVIRDTN